MSEQDEEVRWPLTSHSHTDMRLPSKGAGVFCMPPSGVPSVVVGGGEVIS